jgi:hypothetical protein
MLEWLRGQETVLWWMGALSVATFVGTLIAIPLLVARIPAAYFTRDQRLISRRHTQQTMPGLPGLLLKNLLGLVLILMGLVMLVFPGQGIITILLGLMLVNFPGKRALERRLVQQPSVLRAINWMRAKAQRPPLVVPKSEATTTDQGGTHDRGGH